MKSIFIKTYGCTANKDNESIIRGLLKSFNFVNKIERTDVVILNTCIVKNSSDSKVRSKIKEIVKKFSKKKLIIAGCMPEAEYDICRKIAPDASLINTQHVTDITKAVKSKKRLEFLGKRKESKLNLPKVTKDKKIVNVQIAEGCSSNCSYCITKLAKRNLYSFPEDEIIKEIKLRLEQGYKRINLTSTDSGCYGKDIGSNLPELLKKIVSIKKEFKIRIGMMNPTNVISYLDELIEVYKNKKIIKFVHLPIQSGSNKVLRDMKRNYTVEDFKKIVKKFREEISDINIATDIIVGYPTETEEDFDLTLKLIKNIKPEVLNISKFGARPGTEAAKLKQLKSEEIKKRSKAISEEYESYNSCRRRRNEIKTINL